MIVVDTSVIVYCVTRGEADRLAVDAAAVFRRDPEWSAPPLWRSELRNALALQVRYDGMVMEDAVGALKAAEALVGPREQAVDAEAVLRLAVRSGCTAYDCEFVVLAQLLNVPLVTADKQILKAFPSVAVSLAAFARGAR